MRVEENQGRAFGKYWNQLSFRFPILIVLFSVLVGLSVGGIALYVANGGLIESYKDNMTVLRNERSRAIAVEIASKERLLETFAHAPVGLNGVNDFGRAFRALDVAEREAVIQAYTDGNRFAKDNRIALIDAGDASVYTQVHKAAHRAISYIVQLNKLYDILLVDLEGNVVYTAKKESDFGTNLLNGPLKDELTGDVFRKALANSSPPTPVMADLRRYGPSDNKPSLMMGRALQDASGQITGVAIFQIDSNAEVLSAAANNTLNLGETGEVQLVGEDFLLRSDSRFSKGMTLVQKIDTYAPQRAIAGFEGVETTLDYRGHEVVGAYGPLDVMGVRWGVIAKIDLTEVQAPIRQIALLLLAGALASTMVIGAVGFAVTRSVSRPLKGAIAVLDQLTAGNHGVEVTFDENVHEIRAIGNGLRTFKEGLIKTNALITQVQRSQEQLASLLDSSPTGVIVLSNDNEVLFANDPATYILGVAKSTFIGETFSFADIAVSEVHVGKMISAARREGAVKGAEITVRVPERDEAILNVSVRRTTYMSKEAYLIWFYEITEQKRLQTEIEKALSDSKAERSRTDAILAGAPDPIVIVRSDSVIEYVNTQIEKVLGYAPHELVGQRIETLLPERYRNGHSTQVHSFFETGKVRSMGAGRELYALAKDGREIPVEISLSPVRAGDRSVVVASIRDVTTQKQVAAQINYSNMMSDSALELTTAGYWRIDYADPDYYISSERAAAIFCELPKADWRYHLNHEWLSRIAVVDSEAAEATGKKYAAALEGKTPFYDAIYPYKRPIDGKVIWNRAIGKIERDGDGKPRFMYGVIQNITHIKEAESELEKSKQVAEAATKAKGDFLAAMSHEIRTPMNGVTGMADLLAQTELSDEQRHMVRTIRESGNALITVINDILDFSKIEAGKMDIESVTMSITDAVEGVAATLTPNATKKNVRVQVFVDPNIPDVVYGDPTRLRQILFNMGGNAVKFSNGKDVQIRAEFSGRTDNEHTWLRFSVIDRGIGISKENQAKLFQAFSQAESSTTRRFGGTGLGLAICKRLTEMMNGIIGVESREGHGSTFFVELPFRAASVAPKQKPRDLRDLTILLVGSDGPRAESLEIYLRHDGAEVIRAETADEAVAALKKGPKADSIMIDLGLDAARQDKALAILRKVTAGKTPILLLQDYQHRGARIQNKEVVTVDANPVVRYRIISAAAVAAGRASPQVRSEDDAATFQHGKAPTPEEARAHGQLILLAEDNLTNQDVIRRQLGLLGYACDVTNDGVEALKAYKAGGYALLLTDCHMPEMDGYELTGAIRALEHGTGARFPIIAVTANALQGEAERCLASGMDDYITKPIAMPALVAALKKWMPLPKEVAPPQADDDAKQGPVVDERAIKDIFGDDEATFKEILQSFVAPSQEIVGDILAAHQQRAATGVKNAAHKLKSSARSIGAGALADLCVTLEAAGKAGDWATIDELAPKARDAFVQVETFISKL